MNNVGKLIIHKISLDAIPAGGGVADGIAFLSDKKKISAGFQSARSWVAAVIKAVRLAGEPNPFKDADDETIAGEILKRIEEKKNGR